MVDTESLEHLAFDVALQRWGAAMFGREWIEKLTVPEAMMRQRVEPQLQFPGDDSAFKARLPAEERRSYERAKMRIWQEGEIEGRLASRGIFQQPLNDTAGGIRFVVDKAKFEAAYKAEFGRTFSGEAAPTGAPTEAAVAQSASELGKIGAAARHAPSREKRKKIQDIWAEGNFTTKEACAEQGCGYLDMSFETARKALRNTPNPDPWPANEKLKAKPK